MTTPKKDATAPVLLTVGQAAERLGTGTRFVRRLIAERRIEYHKLGRYVRISEPVLAEFIKNGRVPPVISPRRRVA
jgi:excisionase family DNA binding protein